MKPEDVQRETAKALAQAPALSFAECSRLLSDLVTAIAEAGDRVARITPGSSDGRLPAGVEYRKVLQTGSAEDIQELEVEFRQASILAAQLNAQREELGRRREAARLREAEQGLPKLHEELVSKLDAAEAAKKSLKKALADVSRIAHEIQGARASIRMSAGFEPKGGATIETIQRLSALHSAFSMDSKIPMHPNNWIDDLGCAVSRNVYMTAEGKAPGFDFRGCKSDEDVMRATVLAVRGQDKIDEIEAQPPQDREGALRRAFESIPLQHGPGRIAA